MREPFACLAPSTALEFTHGAARGRPSSCCCCGEEGTSRALAYGLEKSGTGLGGER